MTATPTRTRRDGEGSIRPRPRADGRWEARYRDATGRHVSIYAHSPDEVTRKLREALSDRDVGVPHAASRYTVATWLPTWLEGKRNLRERSRLRYAALIAHWIASPIARRKLHELQPEHMRGAFRWMEREGYSQNTQASAAQILQMALDAAIREGHCGRNVLRLVDKPKGEPVPVRPPVGAELDALVREIRADRLAAMWMLALRGALRQAEILALEWRDVDFNAGTIHVNKSLEHGTQRVGRPKSKAAYRGGPIPMDPDAMDALRRHRERLVAVGVTPHPSRPVFTTRTGHYLHARNVLRWWHEVCERAGVRRFRMHDLRHAATMDLLLDNPIEVVSRFVGHSSLKITADVYGHADPARIRFRAR
jgi:integrase